MLAVNWDAVGYAGAFVVGTLVGAVVTIRLARVIVDFFKSQRENDRSPRSD